MVSEEETLKKLYKKKNPPISQFCVRTPKKVVLKFYFRKQISKAGFNSFFFFSVKHIMILFISYSDSFISNNHWMYAESWSYEENAGGPLGYNC